MAALTVIYEDEAVGSLFWLTDALVSRLSCNFRPSDGSGRRAPFIRQRGLLLFLRIWRADGEEEKV